MCLRLPHGIPPRCFSTGPVKRHRGYSSPSQRDTHGTHGRTQAHGWLCVLPRWQMNVNVKEKARPKFTGVYCFVWMVVMFIGVLRVPLCARVSRCGRPVSFYSTRFRRFADRLRAARGGALASGSGWRQVRVRRGRPLLSRPRGAVDSGLAAVLAAVESVAVFVRACVFGFGWMVVRFVRVIRLPACARVSRVSRV